MLRSLLLALAALAVAAPAAAAHSGELPDAEIFATNNTALITDPEDPRLDDRLQGFARTVERIVDDGGGRPRGSELLDGASDPHANMCSCTASWSTTPPSSSSPQASTTARSHAASASRAPRSGTGAGRATIPRLKTAAWAKADCPRCWRATRPVRFDAPDYAELLGLYLGDGHITAMRSTRSDYDGCCLDARYTSDRVEAERCSSGFRRGGRLLRHEVDGRLWATTRISRACSRSTGLV